MTNDAGELVAIAKDVLVVFDFNKKEKCLMPEEIKEKIVWFFNFYSDIANAAERGIHPHFYY
mgnify:CR=1 FL=1